MKNKFRFLAGALFGGATIFTLTACIGIGNADSNDWDDTLTIKDGRVSYMKPAIIEDEETGVQYIVLTPDSNSAGTVITPRLDEEGKPYTR